MGWGGGWVRAAGDGARGLNNLNMDRGEEGDSGEGAGEDPWRVRGRVPGRGSREGPGFKLFKLFNSRPKLNNLHNLNIGSGGVQGGPGWVGGPGRARVPGPPPANI